MTVQYKDWVKHVFDHPLPLPVEDTVRLAHYDKVREASEKLSRGEATYDDVKEDMQTPIWEKWYFQADAPYLQPEPSQTVAFITRAFNEIDAIAKDYSDAQIDQGLWYVLSNGCSDYMFDLIEDSVSLDQRLATVESFYTVYEKLYATKCTPHLSHVGEVGNPLNMTCYMWWDIIPLYGKSGQFAQEQLDKPILNVMERTLQLDNIACQEGALHGLGHWHHAYPKEVEHIIDAFLVANPDIRTELHQYAQSARIGMVQ